MSAFSFENMQTEIAATLDGGKVGFFMNIHTGWFWNKFGKKTSNWWWWEEVIDKKIFL
jgi:hypothetical protein